ncbi:MAG TPA: lipoyl(octanoyl) transferase LipB [Chthoniobacterales bacterium]|jgi:lipoyl(octanoyl) transferase
MSQLHVQWLGRIDYASALQKQEQLVATHSTDTLLLLEHEPVYTIGRTPDQSSLRSGVLPHPVLQTNRGGQATYHGPGQLVGYPIVDLNPRRRDLHHYLRTLEELLIEVLVGYDIVAQRRDGLTGVWVDDRKIASIGVGVRKWITMHGFALNVSSDLSGFEAITPCGIAGVTMTSLSLELGRPVGVEEFSEACASHFQKHLLSRLV